MNGSGSDLSLYSADADRWFNILPNDLARRQVAWERMMRIYRARKAGAKIVDIAAYLGLSPARVAQIIDRAKFVIERCEREHRPLKAPAEDYINEEGAVAAVYTKVSLVKMAGPPEPPRDLDLFESVLNAPGAQPEYTLERDVLRQLVAYIRHLEKHQGRSPPEPEKIYVVLRKPNLPEDDGRPEVRGFCLTEAEAQSYVFGEHARSLGFFDIRDMQIAEAPALRPRSGIFRQHRCWKCQDGALPCVRNHPNRCEFPQARNH